MQLPGLRAWGPPLGPLCVPSTQLGSSSGRAGGLSDRPDIWHVCTAPISPVQTHTSTPQPPPRQEQRPRVSSWLSGTAPLLRVAPAWSRPHGELVCGAEGGGEPGGRGSRRVCQSPASGAGLASPGAALRGRGPPCASSAAPASTGAPGVHPHLHLKAAGLSPGAARRQAAEVRTGCPGAALPLRRSGRRCPLRLVAAALRA